MRIVVNFLLSLLISFGIIFSSSSNAEITSNDYFNRAIDKIKNNKFDEAEDDLKTAIKLSQLNGEREQEANALFQIAKIKYRIGSNPESLEAYKKSLTIFNSIKNTKGEANALLGLANLERVLSNDAESISYFEKALILYTSIDDRTGEANVFDGLGSVFNKKGQYALAKKYYLDAKRVYSVTKDSMGEGNVLLGIALIDAKQGLLTDARSNFLAAKNLHNSIGNNLGEANVLLEFGRFEYTLDQIESSKKNLQQALQLYENAESILGKANVIQILAEMDLSSNKYDEASRGYTRALNLFISIQNLTGEANSYIGLANLELRKNNFEEASKNFNLAKNIYSKISLPYGVANVEFGLGSLYGIQNNLVEARKHFSIAQLIYKEEKDYYNLALIDHQLGYLELDDHNIEKAKIHFLKASDYYNLAGMIKDSKSMKDFVEYKIYYNFEYLKAKFLILFNDFFISISFLISLIIIILFIFIGYLMLKFSKKNIANEDDLDKVENIGRKWLNYSADEETTVIFIHGIFSNPDAFKNTEKNLLWADLLQKDVRFQRPNIFLGQYYTALDSGNFDIPQAAEDMKEQLTSPSISGQASPISSKNIVFIAHSTGGLVIRDVLTRWPNLFKNKKIGLVLVASPSNGADWADRLKIFIDITNNQMARQLQYANEFVMNLDGRFKDLLSLSNDERGFELHGVDLFENRFIFKQKILSLFVSTKSVLVSEKKSSTYFTKAKVMSDTDHFSIAKPNNFDHPSHRSLVDFWLNRFFK